MFYVKNEGHVNFKRKNSSEQGKTLSIFDEALNDIGDGSAAGSFAGVCHGSDDNIIYNNDKIISRTGHIGGLKGSLKKIKNKIKIILNNKNYESVKQLISLRKSHYKALKKCKRAIETFCTTLEQGSQGAYLKSKLLTLSLNR